MSDDDKRERRLNHWEYANLPIDWKSPEAIMLICMIIGACVPIVALVVALWLRALV